MIAIILLEADRKVFVNTEYIYTFQQEIFCLTKYAITEHLQEIFNELLKDQRYKQPKPIHRQGNNTEKYEWGYTNEVFRRRQL